MGRSSPAVRPGETVQRPAYALPTIALALSIGGLCICLSSVVGAILGIVALLRIRREPRLPGRGRAIAAIVVAVGLLPFQVGMLAAIAIPNFIRYQAVAKQNECKVNLRALSNAQEGYRAAHGRYAGTFAELEFAVPAGNRYAYLLSESAVLPIDARYRLPAGFDPVAEARALSLSVGVSGDRFLAACVGNIDNDPTVDVWTVSSEDRLQPGGSPVPAGTPKNEVDDVTR